MKAIGIKTSLATHQKDCFIAFDTETPVPTGHDILVKVKAVSVNPVDYKVRQNSAKDQVLEQPKILGWDASGTIEAIGDKVSLFNVGDDVFYAGDITRSGSNSEFQIVDERIVGKKPKKLSYAQSAAMPLTSLTAYETFFDRLQIPKDGEKGKNILIIAGAGGVGSIAIQLAKQRTQLTVIATASRDETKKWCLDLGADHVVNHKDLLKSVQNKGFKYVDYIVNCADTEMHWDATSELIKPQGKIASIVGTQKPLDMNKLKSKSASFFWEFMFTKSTYQTDDMITQHYILNEISDLLDTGKIKATAHKIINGFTPESFQKAHELLESGTSIGKIVITL